MARATSQAVAAGSVALAVSSPRSWQVVRVRFPSPEARPRDSICTARKLSGAGPGASMCSHTEDSASCLPLPDVPSIVLVLQSGCDASLLSILQRLVSSKPSPTDRPQVPKLGHGISSSAVRSPCHGRFASGISARRSSAPGTMSRIFSYSFPKITSAPPSSARSGRGARRIAPAPRRSVPRARAAALSPRWLAAG